MLKNIIKCLKKYLFNFISRYFYNKLFYSITKYFILYYFIINYFIHNNDLFYSTFMIHGRKKVVYIKISIFYFKDTRQFFVHFCLC